MAQSLVSLGYVCQSCRNALTRNTARIQLHRDAARSFTSSQSLAKSLATFTPTASPELDSLLASWRQQVFLPSVLSTHHQALVFKDSRKDILIQPPGVSVTVTTSLSPSAPQVSGSEEEVIKLEPLSRWNRLNYRQSFFEITKYLSETPDAKAWDNLIPFLEGLRTARINPPHHFLPRLARKANDPDIARWNTILTAATLSKRTGVTLAHKFLTQELVLGVFQRALQGHFSHQEPSKTMDRIITLLDAPEHQSGRLADPEGAWSKSYVFTDMRHNPTVMALQLVFAAARALRFSAGQDTNGAVAGAIQRILAAEKATPGVLLNAARERFETEEFGSDAAKQNTLLMDLMPFHAAFALADKVNIVPSLGKEKAVKMHVEVQRLAQDYQAEAETVSREVARAKKDNKTLYDKMRGELAMENLQATLKSL